MIEYKLEEYTESLTLTQYRKEKELLQVELLKLQEWVIKDKKRVVIVVEGRDTAGKGSTIKRFVEKLIERKSSDDPTYRVVSLGIPTPEESQNWFKRYEKHLPKESEIVFAVYTFVFSIFSSVTSSLLYNIANNADCNPANKAT